MNLNWKPHIVDKLWNKHRVMPEEVEDALYDENRVRRLVGKDKKRGLRRYIVIAKTSGGRVLSIFLDLAADGSVTPVSARDADDKEHRYYTRGGK